MSLQKRVFTKLGEIFKKFHKVQVKTVFLSVICLLIIDLLIEGFFPNPSGGGLDFFIRIVKTLLPNFIAPGLVFCLYRWWIEGIDEAESANQRTEFLKNIETCLNNTLTTNKTLIGYGGIQNIYNNISVAEPRMVELARLARGRLWILTTWLLDNTGNKYQEAILKNTKRTDGENIPISMLMLKPDSVAFKMRKSDNEAQDKRNHKDSTDLLRELASHNSTNESGLDIYLKYYQSLPYFYLHIFDEIAIVGFYWHSGRASHRTLIEVNLPQAGDFGEYLVQEFINIWTDSRLIENDSALLEQTGLLCQEMTNSKQRVALSVAVNSVLGSTLTPPLDTKKPCFNKHIIVCAIREKYPDAPNRLQRFLDDLQSKMEHYPLEMKESLTMEPLTQAINDAPFKKISPSDKPVELKVVEENSKGIIKKSTFHFWGK